MTAEAVAEYTKRPLFIVTSGELGSQPGEMEAELQRVLDLAKTFRAVLLLDEADVFLEQRTCHDLVRNALVSIFLRQLEYYQGILFLTTNRYPPVPSPPTLERRVLTERANAGWAPSTRPSTRASTSASTTGT